MTAATPTAYAAAKLATLRRRWDGPIGEAVRAFGPRVWPGVPPTALLGLTASAVGPTEAIGNLATSGSAVGVFGVEGPNVRALATDPDVVRLLGRPARAEITADGYLSDIKGQVATGLVNYARALGAVLDRIPHAVWAGDDAGSSSLLLRIAASAYSAGPGITAAVLNHYAAELARAELPDRWPLLAQLVARETAPRIAGYEVDGRYHVAFLVVRSEQRLESGAALERATSGSREAWFALWSSRAPDTVAELVRRAYGTDDTGHDTPGGASPSSATADDDGWMFAAAAMAWAAWRYLR